jgi:hypothetical protein
VRARVRTRPPLDHTIPVGVGTIAPVLKKEKKKEKLNEKPNK